MHALWNCPGAKWLRFACYYPKAINGNDDIHFQDFFLFSLDVFGWAIDFLRDYQAARFVASNPVASLTSAQIWRWIVPAEGIYKINTDAAFKGYSNQGGVGIIVRNSDGHVMRSSIQKIAICSSPLIVEAIAILKGLHFAVDSSLLSAVLESDAKWVVDLINNEGKSDADIGVIVSDIVAVSNSSGISISFVPRTANMAAHSLAKMALLSDVNDLF
ncbi:hypothetical protein Dsin_001473 [Dipteronia sinensis]|uniref:RNase H type-1 domain-containing protein n=1 Tax=Dipteronia sinensis TaxID=43782 RepID=A0AAE0B4C6_9ROSI|nr:hypothetical protein Dsin_001473 [Dipteronia sinensis]